MKDGDVSLVLKNVMTADSGTYVCRVDFSKPNHSRRSPQKPDYITKYYLQVLTPDHNITAEPGDTITLPCRSDDSRPVVVVQWDRTDLRSDHVLLFRDDHIFIDGQDPSFKNRVDLQDRQMKDGNVSLVLKNVTTADSGTYVCQVQSQGSQEKIKTCTIQLQVSLPGHKEGRDGGQQEGHDGGHQDGTSAGPSGLMVVLVVLSVVALMIPAVIVIIVKRRLARHPPPPPPDEAVELGPINMSDRTPEQQQSSVEPNNESEPVLHLINTPVPP
ncbi:CD226 antigen [Austrofundulus limnaeus]|uniref:CD226 antigen n=1 Tax=Austrofundulus limnaeus TaxID=52670 RepID=A0A2I4CJ98_AUSLI|nr:PREDICTED: CD226 antigen-like [Austrofundulus limnaeus]